MKEITFAYPLNSSITRTIKVCETQRELIKIIRERFTLKNGTVFVLYKDNSYFFQLLGSDGYKTSQLKRYGIKSATVSSSSGELFIFGGFSITPDGLVAIDENTIKKYGLYSGQYDVKPEKVETISGQYDFKPEKSETKTEKVKTKVKTKTKITINMEHFEDDMDYFMEHFDNEYGYELIMWY